VNPSWQVLELRVDAGPALEVRAERLPDGGWRIRAERSRGPAEAVSLGWLNASPPAYGVAILHG